MLAKVFLKYSINQLETDIPSFCFFVTWLPRALVASIATRTRNHLKETCSTSIYTWGSLTFYSNDNFFNFITNDP